MINRKGEKASFSRYRYRHGSSLLFPTFLRGFPGYWGDLWTYWGQIKRERRKSRDEVDALKIGGIRSWTVESRIEVEGSE